jgi:hypothetical protein
MKERTGYLITYNSSSRKDITKINYFLFGRIATIKNNNKKERYYYPGFFEKTSYIKIANGCYFVEQISDDLDGLLKIHPATIMFTNINMLNAREYWKNKIGIDVRNWVEEQTND